MNICYRILLFLAYGGEVTRDEFWARAKWVGATPPEGWEGGVQIETHYQASDTRNVSWAYFARDASLPGDKALGGVFQDAHAHWKDQGRWTTVQCINGKFDSGSVFCSLPSADIVTAHVYDTEDSTDFACVEYIFLAGKPLFPREYYELLNDIHWLKEKTRSLGLLCYSDGETHHAELMERFLPHCASRMEAALLATIQTGYLPDWLVVYAPLRAGLESHLEEVSKLESFGTTSFGGWFCDDRF